MHRKSASLCSWPMCTAPGKSNSFLEIPRTVGQEAQCSIESMVPTREHSLQVVERCCIRLPMVHLFMKVESTAAAVLGGVNRHALWIASNRTLRTMIRKDVDMPFLYIRAIVHLHFFRP